MLDRLVHTVQPHIITNGRPTEVTKMLVKTKQGRMLLCRLINIARYKRARDFRHMLESLELDTDINIEDYRYSRMAE